MPDTSSDALTTLVFASQVASYDEATNIRLPSAFRTLAPLVKRYPMTWQAISARPDETGLNTLDAMRRLTGFFKVGRRRLTVSELELKARLISAFEAKM